MSVPIAKPANALVTPFHLLLLIAICLVFHYLTGYFAIGIGVFYAYAIISREFFIRDHQQGIRLTKQAKFTEAIPCFHKSLDHLTKNAWIDKYRALTVLTPAVYTYREMAMVNIAFCYSQIGEPEKAIEWYRRVLAEYPNNGLAISALNFIESIKVT